MINPLKLVKFPLIKSYLLKKMLKFTNIQHSFKVLGMVLIETFLSITQNVTLLDVKVSNLLDAKF